MTDAALRHRLARRADIPALTALLERAIAELQKPFLDLAQIAASRALMGLGTQLIGDGTLWRARRSTGPAAIARSSASPTTVAGRRCRCCA